MLHALKWLPSIIQPTTIKNAKRVIMETMLTYMEFRGLQELSANSEEYLLGLVKIQQFFKLKTKLYR